MWDTLDEESKKWIKIGGIIGGIVLLSLILRAAGFGSGSKYERETKAPPTKAAPAQSDYQPPPSPPPAAAPTHRRSSGPSCTKGKRCGNTCIAVDKTCHM